MLMIGSPGTGKTMLARRLPTILPPLTPAESLETTRIYSALGRLPAGEPLLATRPFRPPHHTISDNSIGGGMLWLPDWCRRVLRLDHTPHPAMTFMVKPFCPL
jgi:predicted ATPase with chaperone activity